MTTQQTTYAHSEEAKYIVSLNEKLLDETKKLRQEFAELKSEHDTIENEIDQREKQVTYMRGLLKNFVELDTLNKHIADEYNMLNRDINKLQVVYESTQRNQLLGSIAYVSLLSVIFILYLLIDLNAVEILLSVVFIDNSIKFYFYRKYNQNVKYKESIEMFSKSRLDKIHKSKNKIEIIMKGCDFLNEYIDCI